MLQRFELHDGKTARFWEIQLDHKTLQTRYGKIGSNGRRNEKVFPYLQDAQMAVRKKIDEKIAAGYVEVEVEQPPPEDLGQVAVDVLKERADEAREENRYDDLVPLSIAILERDPEHFKSRIRLGLMLDAWDIDGRVEIDGQAALFDAQRAWLLASDEVNAEQRVVLLLSEARVRLKSKERSMVESAFALLAEAKDAGAEDEDIAAMTSSIHAQLSLVEIAEGNAEAGHQAFYHLLCADVCARVWNSALDDSVRDRHLGVALEQAENFVEWVIGLTSRPPMPERLRAFLGEGRTPSGVDDLMLLVAGQKNYYKKSQLKDTWAPGRTERMAFLVHCGADVNATESYDQSTVLHHLAGCGDGRAIAFALSRGAKIEAKDRNGETPLFWAADGRQTEAAILELGKHGADVHVVAKNERTAMYNAAYNGREKTVAAMAAIGVDLNAPSGVMTPIEMPARNENYESAKAMLEHGAIPTQRALDEATRYKNHRVARMLSDALKVAPIGAADVRDHVTKLAKDLGVRAATEALDGGDYGYYKSEDGLDASTLSAEYWEANFSGNLLEAIGVLDTAAQEALPPEAELLATAFVEYQKGWDEMMESVRK